MAIDKYMFLADAQTLVHATGSWDTTNSFNTKIVSSDLGAGRALWAIARIKDTYLATGGASELVVKLQNAPDSGGSAGSYVDMGITSAAISKATLVAGYVIFEIALPKITLQWIKGVLTISTNNGTSGSIDVWFELR